MPTLRFLLLACLLLASHAWAGPQEVVIPVENVRLDYAQVLRVEPVYQTLHASRTEQQCDPSTEPAKPQAKGFSRIVGAVRNALSKDADANPPSAPQVDGNCRLVQVQREFRRPIAYDVDYIYKGMKYRSRLPQDPGNRLRIRVSVTPYVSASDR